MNKENEQDLKTLLCPICKIPEDTATTNSREDSTLVFVKSLYTPINLQDLIFYKIICFKCKNITLISIDPKNQGLYRYVETEKATELDIRTTKRVAESLKIEDVSKKLDSFKL